MRRRRGIGGVVSRLNVCRACLLRLNGLLLGIRRSRSWLLSVYLLLLRLSVLLRLRRGVLLLLLLMVGIRVPRPRELFG